MTSLHDVAATAGAVFRDYGGVELPEKFTDAVAECEQARAAAGLFDLSFRGRVRASGPDRTTFLHNLLTSDVLALRPGNGSYATLLTEQSKIVADLIVFCRDEDLLLDIDVRYRRRALDHLAKYLIADEVELEERDDETTIGVHGPKAADSIERAFPGGNLPSRPYDHHRFEWNGIRFGVARVDWIGAPGFDVGVPRDYAPALWNRLLEAGEPLGLRPAGMSALDVLRLEAGVPWLGADFDESTLVIEAGLERAISFTKGCYLGQETVERVTARGHVNRKLVGVTIEGDSPPIRGARILSEGAEVGKVTSATFSPTLRSSIALGYVKREVMEAGTRVEIELPNGSAAASVARLPFIRG